MKSKIKHLSTVTGSRLTGRSAAVVSWAIENSQSKAVLDFGCGYGWLVHNLVRFGNPNFVVGVDLDDEAIETAQKSVLNEATVFMNLTEFSSQSYRAFFDVVISSEVIEHTPVGFEKTFLVELANLVRPGGLVLLTTPAGNIRSRFLDPAFWLVGHRHYSRKKLCELIEGTGLNVVSMRRRGGLFEVVSIYDLYISKWILRRSPVFERFYHRKLDLEWRGPNEGWMGWWVELEKR